MVKSKTTKKSKKPVAVYKSRNNKRSAHATGCKV